MLKTILITFLAILTISGCRPVPDTNTNVEDFIENSQRAMVHIFYGDKSCSGFHVGSDIIVTAAHCFSDLPSYATKNITMNSYSKNELYPEAISVDHDKDLAILYSADFPETALALWDTNTDGPVRLGSPVAALGYPGYYDMHFTFEIGYVKDIVIDHTGLLVIKGRNMIYPGESGGPLISLKNGKVIGVGHTVYGLMLEGITKSAHKHYDIGIFVSTDELIPIFNSN